MHAYINGLGLLGPGLDGWEKAKHFLTGSDAYIANAMEKITINILQPNERRRTTALIKLALKVSREAVGDKFDNASDYISVFSASDGDHAVIDNICMAISTPEHQVSPTNFHNSVHNAPGGYWAIAAGATLSSTSIAACDESFSAGLIESVSIVDVEKMPVLFVAYDFPPTLPISALREVKNAFAVAMILRPEKTTDAIASVSLTLNEKCEFSQCADSKLEALRLDNPAARSMPLLALLAANNKGEVCLPAVQNRCLQVQVTPCR